MKKLLKYLTLIVFISSISFAQNLDELSSTVVFLTQKYPDNKIKYGTGFFVASEKSTYLITAQHVSNFLTTNSNLTIRTELDKPYNLKLKQLIIKDSLDWKYHEEGDIALLKLFITPELIKYLKGHFLSLSNIYSEKKSLSREITITILGFPLMLGTEELFSPISRETKPASGFLKLPRADTKTLATFFITQDPSIGGFSGGPVFDLGLPIQSSAQIILRSLQPQVVGLVHGTLSDDTGGKLGAIVPSFQIYELIMSAEKKN